MDNNEEEVRDLREKVLLLEAEHNNLKDKVSSNHKSVMDLVKELVTRVEFTPVKMIAYGLAGTIMSSVLMALLTKVITK